MLAFCNDDRHYLISDGCAIGCSTSGPFRQEYL